MAGQELEIVRTKEPIFFKGMSRKLFECKEFSMIDLPNQTISIKDLKTGSVVIVPFSSCISWEVLRPKVVDKK